MLKTLFRFKLIFVACAAVLAASPALAQGGGGFGVTLGGQNLGPRYPETRDAMPVAVCGGASGSLMTRAPHFAPDSDLLLGNRPIDGGPEALRIFICAARHC